MDGRDVHLGNKAPMEALASSWRHLLIELRRWAEMPLAEVIAEALARNPEIVAAQKRHDAAQRRPAQEREPARSDDGVGRIERERQAMARGRAGH